MTMLGTSQQAAGRSTSVGAGAPNASRALDWLWRHFQDSAQPHILDCGPVSQATLNVLVRRGAKLYVADLVTPARRKDPQFWDRRQKHPVFQVEDFLTQLPNIPSGSLAAVFCWHLFDLLPPDSLPALVERLCSYLQPGGGTLFCLLRESFLDAGAETLWWLDRLTILGSGGSGREPFPYPVVTNRAMERLVAPCTVKTFLTRSGRREVLAIK